MSICISKRARRPQLGQLRETNSDPREARLGARYGRRVSWWSVGSALGDLVATLAVHGPPKVCKRMAFWAVLSGFGPLFYIL